MADYDKSTTKDDITVRLQSVIDFLGKPLYVSTTSWTTGQVPNTLLTSFSIEATLNANTFWKDKIEGFGLMRATACMRVQLNANPFQCGKILVHFLPNYTERDTLDQSYATANYMLTSKTQQPGCQIDCRDSVAMLRIPYVAPTNWYPRYTTGSGVGYGWGTVFITVLGQLATGGGGEATCDITTYLHFEDVELAAPIVPQSKAGGKGKKFGARVVKDIASAELEFMGDKPISSALRLASSGASTLAKIPLLEPIALPVAWAADAGAKIASYLGWSKPTNNISSMIVSQQFNRYSANSDGPDNSYSLGLRSDNCIKISTDRTVYSEDEMSWDFLKKVSYLLSTTSWNDSSHTSGVNILSFSLSPSLMYVGTTKTVGAHTATINFGGPLYYVSSQFQYFRGSIDLTFKFAKTEYHTGRLQITFTPTVSFTTSPTLATSMLALREIIDLRVSNTFTINCPYMLENNFINVTQSIGQLDVVVLNELRHPETASVAIDMLCFVNAGDDFELALPSMTNANLPFSTQGGNVEEGGDVEVLKEGVGNEPIKSLTTRYVEESIGEQFLSIKQLLNRSSLLQFGQSAPGATNSMYLWPWARTLLYMNSSTGVMSSALVGFDLFSRFAPMYAYYRGGMRIMLRTAQLDNGNMGRNNTCTVNQVNAVPGTTNVLSMPGVVFDGGWYTMTQTPYTALINSGSQGFVVTNAGVGVLSVSAPYYAKCGTTLNAAQTTSNVIPNDISQVPYVINFSGGAEFTGNTGFTAFRSVKDDFQLQYFIGCPPIFVSTT